MVFDWQPDRVLVLGSTRPGPPVSQCSRNLDTGYTQGCPGKVSDGTTSAETSCHVVARQDVSLGHIAPTTGPKPNAAEVLVGSHVGAEARNDHRAQTLARRLPGASKVEVANGHRAPLEIDRGSQSRVR